VFIGAERAAALQHDANFDLVLCNLSHGRFAQLFSLRATVLTDGSLQA
jgi:hypothetical protein